MKWKMKILNSRVACTYCTFLEHLKIRKKCMSILLLEDLKIGNNNSTTYSTFDPNSGVSTPDASECNFKRPHSTEVRFTRFQSGGFTIHIMTRQIWMKSQKNRLKTTTALKGIFRGHTYRTHTTITGSWLETALQY